MIIIDENFPDSQRQLLRGWRISFKQVGVEIGREGMKDDEIRMGSVIRISHAGLSIWRVHVDMKQAHPWA